MSVVTNVLLSLEGIEFDEDEKCREINDFFERKGIRGFVSLENDALPKRWYGGTKLLEAHVYLGAFNHLELAALIEHILQLEWPGAASVQLLVKRHEESLFESHVVVDQGWDNRSPG